MANSALFKTKNVRKTKTPIANKVNKAGGLAYKTSNRGTLAIYASTGTFGGTYYSTAKTQLDEVLELLNKVAKEKGGHEFIGKLVVYSREYGLMKDMPAFLLSFLAVHAPEVYERVFSKVIDNGKMLRNHIQFVRSGVFGKKSLPRAMRRQCREWFTRRPADRIFKDSVGNDPSMSDVIKMLHPRPTNKEQEAVFGYIIGKDPVESRNLPSVVKQYEKFKNNKRCKIPDVPFQMLDSLGLTKAHWKKIAKNARWQMTRMNLNTFQRHDVFKDEEMVEMISNRLSDPEEIKKAKAFPYQLMAAYMNADNSIPMSVSDSLHEAMEVATQNVPKFIGNVWVFVDVSASMGSRVTGTHGKKVASKMRCIDVASLFGASVLRNNPKAKVIPFDTSLKKAKISSKDSIMTIAEKLTRNWGGGTNCALGPEYIAKEKEKCDLCIIVSDNESWVDSAGSTGRYYRASGVMNAWDKIKKSNPNAKLVNIDIAPYGTTQAPDRDDIMNIGGFSDNIWEVIANFAEYGRNSKNWVDFIENTIQIG